VCKDDKHSVDMTIWRMLGRKIGAVDAVVDGKEVRDYCLVRGVFPLGV
jgi:hypothetical protein